MGDARRERIRGMSMLESPNDPIDSEIAQALEDLIDMGLVDVVGINEQGQWLYASTDKGKRVVQDWID
jgi:DNA-binding PadR family transcriptional regulator